MKAILGSKRILIYGDSITWGRVANEERRYDENTRWTCLLQQRLGDAFEVIEEGLRGRMLKGENLRFKNRDGLSQFGPILASHLPVDLLIFFLGTNDVLAGDKSPAEIANALPDYFELIGTWCHEFGMKIPQVLIVSPPRIDESALGTDRSTSSPDQKTKNLPELYKNIALANNTGFFDATKAVNPGNLDGIHIDEAANAALAEALEPAIREILQT